MLKLKIGAKVIITVNLDTKDSLINDQPGNISHSEFAQSSVPKVYLKLSDEQSGLKAMKSSYLGRQNSWVPIEKCQVEIPIKKGSCKAITGRPVNSFSRIVINVFPNLESISVHKSLDAIDSLSLIK